MAVASVGRAHFLEEAVASVLRQDLADIEVIIQLDGDCDQGARDRVQRLADLDRRVVVDRPDVGPDGSAAFSRVADLARGEWLARLGAEDLMHPARLGNLLAVGRRDGADIVADNVLVFGDDERVAPRALLSARRLRGLRWVGAKDVSRHCRALGGLEPLISLSALRALGGGFGDATGLGDPELILRLVSAGRRYRIDPMLGYFRRAGAKSLRPLTPPPATRKACVISRQRLIGRTNGSSAYLLDLAQSIRRAGLEPHLVQPTPMVLGRWPVLRLKPEMKVFASIAMRGVVRLGPLALAINPLVWARAARAAAVRGLMALGLPSPWPTARPAPYAIAAPWAVEDLLFVARFARRSGDVLIADYGWQTEAFPYALRPRAPTAVITHDLFHNGPASSLAALSRDEEGRLLGQADAVIAIQAREAEEMGRMTPGRRVIVAPMSAEAAPSPQPGDARTVLFVASRTGPNVGGLQWMIDEVWPQVRAARPGAQLLVAGNICRAFGPPPPGVRFLGPVERLQEIYRQAGVVVSPLRTGSGLKIKLIEALALGKACVVTSVTLQGVESEAAEAVARADAPQAFAAAVIGLLANRGARIELGERALAAVRRNFSPEKGHAAFMDWLRDAPASPPQEHLRRIIRQCHAYRPSAGTRSTTSSMALPSR